MEVVGSLCEDPGPIDRIDCSEVECVVYFRIGKEGFNCVLCCVRLETATDIVY